MVRGGLGVSGIYIKIFNHMDSERFKYKCHLTYNQIFVLGYFPEILLTMRLSLAITIVTQMREQKKRWEPHKSFLIHNTIIHDSAVTSL